MDKLTTNDRLGQRKGWVRDFVEEGIPFEQACLEAYLEKEEIEEIKKDDEFMLEIQDITVRNKIKFLREYNKKVDKSKNPADTMKKLQAQFPQVFDDPNNRKDDMPVAPVLISIGQGEIRTVKQETIDEE